jgi:hypothetical protein
MSFFIRLNNADIDVNTLKTKLEDFNKGEVLNQAQTHENKDEDFLDLLRMEINFEANGKPNDSHKEDFLISNENVVQPIDKNFEITDLDFNSQSIPFPQSKSPDALNNDFDLLDIQVSQEKNTENANQINPKLSDDFLSLDTTSNQQFISSPKKDENPTDEFSLI